MSATLTKAAEIELSMLIESELGGLEKISKFTNNINYFQISLEREGTVFNEAGVQEYRNCVWVNFDGWMHDRRYHTWFGKVRREPFDLFLEKMGTISESSRKELATNLRHIFRKITEEKTIIAEEL